MDTTIGYLDELREDLLDAAWREVMPGARKRTRSRWLPTRRVLAGVMATVVLVSAGLTGWIVTRPQATMRASSGGYAFAPLAGPSAKGLQQTRPQVPHAGLGFPPGWQVGMRNPADVSVRAGSIAIGDLTRIVKTADMTLVVPRSTFAQRFQAAMDVAARLGGFVQTSSTSGRRSGELLMRVPAGRFNPALDALRALGTVDQQTVTGKNVTSQYIDLQARIRIAKARRKVLFGLMSKATTIEQTIRVQNALDDVQLQIEQLQGQLNVLNNQTSKATIRLSMREEGVKPAEATVHKPSIPNAFDRSIAGFFGVISTVVVGLGYVVPIGLLLIALAFVALRVRRRLAS
jgi:Domain of unknown function (DUF4349)